MRLLTRSTRIYIIYASIMMLIAIPIFYVLIHEMFIQDVDELLMHNKSLLLKQIQQHHFDELRSISKANWQTNLVVQPIPKPLEIPKDRWLTVYDSNPINQEQVPYRVLSTILADGDRYYRVQIRMSLIDSEDLIRSIVLTIGMLWALLLLGWIGLSRFQSKKLWQPFYDALHQLKQFQLNQHTAPQFATQLNILEFQELNQVLNLLTHHIVSTYQREKEFTENMAHEMQTPLTVMQSQIELLLQDTYLNQTHAQHLQFLHQAVRRLSRISRSLLLLTRIEHHQFEELSDVDLHEEIRKNLLLMEPLIEARGLTLLYQVNAYPRVRMHPFLAEVLISNLMSNAVRHNIDGGQISLELTADRLCVANTGVSQPLDDRVFDRYRAGTGQGNGLGLAIVREICRTANLHLHYQFQDPWHKFQIHFQPVEAVTQDVMQASIPNAQPKV
ncbi:MAG: HAMP domain-containing histidine kinase [Thermoflavifilum sp.]|nr:HAMP domain-containing histidine kinase [Thermoflavifilum sp.]